MGDDVRRFILHNIRSVPFLEALLLLRSQPAQAVGAAELARRLYVAPKVAGRVLDELHAGGFVSRAAAGKYGYSAPPEIVPMIDKLVELYSTNLLAVTELIHSGGERSARQFADAFRLRKDE